MMDVLFPDGRYVVTWVAAAFLVGMFLFATDGGDAALLCATVAAAFWAQDCLGRLRRWEASTLVPGYALTVLVVVVGAVGAVMTLASTVSYLAGNKAPAFGVAAMAGVVLLVVLTYAKRPTTIHRVLGILSLIAAAVLIVQLQFGSPIAWPEMAHPLIQWPALAIAVAAVVALKGRLDRPLAQRLEISAIPWDYFRPFVAGPRDVFGGWVSRRRAAEGVSIGLVLVITLHAYDVWDSGPSLLTAFVFYAIFIGSLTPLMLLKGAGRWLSTAWQLGAGDDRTAIGQMFALRIVIATSATLAWSCWRLAHTRYSSLQRLSGLDIAICSMRCCCSTRSASGRPRGPVTSIRREQPDSGPTSEWSLSLASSTWSCFTRRRRLKSSAASCCCSCSSPAWPSPFTPAGVRLPESTSCQRTKTDQRDLGGSMTESPLNLRGVPLSYGQDPDDLFVGVTP